MFPTTLMTKFASQRGVATLVARGSNQKLRISSVRHIVQGTVGCSQPRTTNLVSKSILSSQNLHRVWFSTAPPSPPKDSDKESDTDKDETEQVVQTKPKWFQLRLAQRFQTLILKSRITDDPDLSRLVGTSLAWATYSLAGISLLGTCGIDTKPLVAGVGVTGFTIGFALKEVVGGFLSGVVLVLSKPFSTGQYVRLQLSGVSVPIEGIVQSIDARYVRIQSTEDVTKVHVVPSSLAYACAVVVEKAPKVVKKTES